MRYYHDGERTVIRVHTNAERGSRQFFFSVAEIWDGHADKWYQRPNLIGDILNSGYYTPTGEPTDEETQWMGSDTPNCTECGRPVHAGDEVVLTTYTNVPTTGGNWLVRHRGHANGHDPLS